jgi:hypothetical protein
MGNISDEGTAYMCMGNYRYLLSCVWESLDIYCHVYGKLDIYCHVYGKL